MQSTLPVELSERRGAGERRLQGQPRCERTSRRWIENIISWLPDDTGNRQAPSLEPPAGKHDMFMYTESTCKQRSRKIPPDYWRDRMNRLSIVLAVIVTPAFAQTLCPDGSYVGSSSCNLTPDGGYVGGEPRLAPDGTYVGGEPSLTPDGDYVGGKPELAPDGTYVGGEPRLAPDGTYVGVAEESD